MSTGVAATAARLRAQAGPWLTWRVCYGMLVGALVAVVLCAAGGLLGSIARVSSRALTAVWTLNFEAAAWRGGALGLLVGRCARSGSSLLASSALGAAGCIIYDLEVQRQYFVLPAARFDPAVVLHYTVNAALVSGVTYIVLAKAAGRDRRPRAAAGLADHTPPGSGADGARGVGAESDDGLA